MTTRNILLTCIIALLPAISNAQKKQVEGDKFCFNHLSIGGSIGTTGLGVELATPINKHLTIRGAFNVLVLGTLKVKLTNSMGDIYSMMEVTDKNVIESANNKKVEVGMKIKSITGKILLDYYPWDSKSFHLTGGLIFSNRNVLHIFNTEEGNMMFSTLSNRYVSEYNKYFHTAYPKVGLKFGEYIFTADENGNLDVKMLVNAVRPYIGVGWGRNINIDASHKRKIRTNVDLGFEYWGSPQFKLNNGEKLIKTDNDSESGALKFISGFWAWPTLKLTLCGDLF